MLKSNFASNVGEQKKIFRAGGSMYWQINIERVAVFSCKKSLTQRLKIVEYFFDIRHDP